MNSAVIPGIALTILFIVLPKLGSQIDKQLPKTSQRVLHSLLLFSSIAIIPAFAMVEMAGRYGIITLVALIVFGLLDMLSPIILRPVQWFTNRHHISSLTDILVFRFRGRAFGQLITLTLILTCLPLAIAHLVAVFDVLHAFLSLPTSVLSNSLIVAAVCVLLIGFFWPQQLFKENASSLTVPIACCAVFVIVALLIVTLTIIQQAFGGMTPMNNWVETNHQYTKLIRLENAPAILALFFCANIVLPQFYRLRANIHSEKTVSFNAWFFPLLLLLSTLPMFPLLWSGIALKAEIPLQMYASLLSSLKGNQWLSVLAVTAGLTAALSGLTMLLITLVQPVVNYLLMPATPDFSSTNLYHWLTWRNRLAFIALLAIVLAGTFVVNSNSITDLLLVSFAGLAQLAPGLLATFYFPNINRKAVVCGLCAGLLLWFAGLFLPLFFGEWHLSLSPFYSDLVVGPSNFSSLFYEALLLNICGCMLVARLSTMDEKEKYYAELCMVDNLPEPRRDLFRPGSVDEFSHELAKVLGDDVANDQVHKVVEKLGVAPSENRPLVLRQFRERLNASMNALLGTDIANKVMSKAFPIISSKDVFTNFLTIDNLLDVAGNRLSGLSKKLNKLRLYHRDTLENIPIGVCALDEGGEIVFWNRIMEEISMIPGEQAQGCMIEQLPAPWNEAFSTFLQGDQPSEFAIEISVNDNSQWYILHKASIESHTTDNASSQILLLEDVSEMVMLSRGLMHSERLASVGRLAAGVAHEIGNPVTGIACLAQDMLGEEDPEENQKSAKMILEQTHRINDIVQSLTAFSRTGAKSSQDFQAISLLKPASEAIMLLELRNDRQLIFKNNIPQNMYVVGDTHQLTQVFLNLLTNAYDASPENGIISIDVECLNDKVEIRVSDQGPGIPEDIRSMIFEPFFTTKDIGKGTGLGLSLVHDIISLHKGEISIEDSDNGNCMVIKLPLAFATHPRVDHNSEQT